MQVSWRSSSERKLRRLDFHLIALIVKFWLTLMASSGQPHKSVKPSLFFSSSARWLWLTEPKCATDDGRVTWEAPRKCRNDEIYSSFLKRILVYSDTVYRAGVFQARNMISMLVVCRLSFCHAAQSDNMVKAVDAAYHECVYSLNCASKPTKCGSSFHQVDRTDIRSCVTRGITRTYSICLTHEDTVGAAVPAIHICCPYSRESP